MMGRMGPPLSETARELIAGERQRGPEDEALKQRVLERAREAMAPDRPSGVALRAAGSAGWPAARRAPRAVLLIAAALAVAGLAAAGAGMYRFMTPTRTTSVKVAPVAQAPKPAEARPQPAPAPVVEQPQAEVPPPQPPRAAAPAENAHATSVQQYAVELGVLEPARSSIGRGDYAGAMSAIARHQREYPRGQLAQEREALRVRALWGMGQKASAESAAAAFRKRYPRSVLLSWMKEPAKQSP
jgi:hypothetical protein